MNTIKIQNENTYFYYLKNILNEEYLLKLKKWLENKEYKSGTLINGKEICRQQLWYQKDQKYFCNSWKYRYDRWVSENYDDFLIELQDYINKIVNNICIDHNLSTLNINSCLINKYRDGQDSIKSHTDNKESFGEYPIITGLSIGDTRKLVFKKIQDINSKSLKIDESYDPISYTLEDNSLFIMAGASQKYFTHEIPKCDSKNIRYSLTFREFKEQ